jgi:hypothetical protein
MPGYAHVVFPRKEGNINKLYWPRVDPFYGDAPRLEPFDRQFNCVVLDVLLLDGEAIDTHEQAIVARAVKTLEKEPRWDVSEFYS